MKRAIDDFDYLDRVNAYKCDTFIPIRSNFIKPAFTMPLWVCFKPLYYFINFSPSGHLLI